SDCNCEIRDTSPQSFSPSRIRLVVSPGASPGERSPAIALYLDLNLEKTFVAVRTMPDHSRYGDAWHSNSRFSRQIGALKKGTRRARASIEPVRKEEVMCHANRAASAYGLGGLNRWAPQYLPLPPARQADPPNY